MRLSEAHALKVLIVLPYEPSTFMQIDIDILRRHFNVDTVVHNRGEKQLARATILRHLILHRPDAVVKLVLQVLKRLLFNRPDVLLMWFIVPTYALPLTLLAKLFGVKVGFFTGGYDVASMPKIGFGTLRIPLFRRLLKPTLALADMTITQSAASERQVLKYARPRRVVVLYHGIDTDFFSPDPSIPRDPLAVTVSPIIESSITQKGLRTFVEAARYAPGVRFALVGRSPDGSIERLREIATSNVEFIDRFLPVEELRDLYRRASCYVQASVHEGFGIAVAEAMACGAVPVVTKRFSLPEVTGGLGEYVPLADPAAIGVAVSRAVRADEQRRHLIRSYIVENFPYRRRESELAALLRGLVSQSE